MLRRHRGRVLFSFIICIMIISTFILVGENVVIADDEVEPDITVYIHGESAGGPIFHNLGDIAGNQLWAPGVSDSGTMRIYNNFSKRIRVNNLSLDMKLEKLQEGEYKPVIDKELYENFAKHMKLTIKKGTMLVFTKTIYNKSFYEMLYKQNNKDYKGYDLSALNRFNLGKNDYVDLEYTVLMDEKAGNEFQGLRATVAFIVNSEENPEYHPPKPPKPPETPKESDENEVAVDADGHWCHDCIETLIEHGILKGYPDGSIRPENYVTRAEIAVLIGRALGLEEDIQSKTIYRDDIPEWAKAYINALTDEEIFQGYLFKLFKPTRNISRQEMVAVLVRAFDKYLDGEVELEFKDRDEIPKWSLHYVKAGVQNKIIEGYPDNTFKPKKEITRAEAFTLICKILGYHEEHEQKNN